MCVQCCTGYSKPRWNCLNCFPLTCGRGDTRKKGPAFDVNIGSFYLLLLALLSIWNASIIFAPWKKLNRDVIFNSSQSGVWPLSLLYIPLDQMLLSPQNHYLFHYWLWTPLAFMHNSIFFYCYTCFHPYFILELLLVWTSTATLPACSHQWRQRHSWMT